MSTYTRTIGNAPYEQLLSVLRAAVPSLLQWRQPLQGELAQLI